MRMPKMPRRPSSRRRFARRAWSRRWATLRRVAVAVVLLALVAGAGWLVFVSSVLAVRDVAVTGTRTVAEQRISAAAEVPVGRPLARVDTGRIRERVEDVPVVASADVSRSWPHTVAIEITERTPVAAVGEGDGHRLIDADGVMYRRVEKPPAGLPSLAMDGNPRAAQEAAAVVAGLPRDLGRRIAEVEATTMDAIELELRDGRRVVWGSAESSQLKAEVLDALLARKRDARVYDVSVPTAPTLSVD